MWMMKLQSSSSPSQFFPYAKNKDCKGCVDLAGSRRWKKTEPAQLDYVTFRRMHDYTRLVLCHARDRACIPPCFQGLNPTALD